MTDMMINFRSFEIGRTMRQSIARPGLDVHQSKMRLKKIGN